MNNAISSYNDTELYALLGQQKRVREAAFAELYTRYSSRVFLYCRYILGSSDVLQDVFQETWLRFLKSANSQRTVENVPAYLLRICRNLCFDTKKGNSGRVLVSLDDFQFPVQDNRVETHELERLVAMALEMVSDEQREAFVLQVYNGLTYKEIADVIGEPVSTVRNRVVRAKHKIRAVLAPYFAEY